MHKEAQKCYGLGLGIAIFIPRMSGRKKECIARSIEECKRLYGLGTYREYEPLSVKSA